MCWALRVRKTTSLSSSQRERDVDVRSDKLSYTLSLASPLNASDRSALCPSFFLSQCLPTSLPFLTTSPIPWTVLIIGSPPGQSLSHTTFPLPPNASPLTEPVQRPRSTILFAPPPTFFLPLSLVSLSSLPPSPSSPLPSLPSPLPNPTHQDADRDAKSRWANSAPFAGNMFGLGGMGGQLAAGALRNSVGRFLG
jgi:hypothetical protein